MKHKKYPVLKWLFQQYQDDSIRPDQKKLIDDWFDQHAVEQDNDILSNDSEQRIYQELNERVWAVIHQPVRRLRLFPALLKVACVLLLISVAAILFWRKPHAAQSAWTDTYQTVVTGKGIVKKIVLGDGTSIWLNAATTIRIPASYQTAKSRKIYLDNGEAFFIVRHDSNRPFSVISGNLITRDIGTSFDIRAYGTGNEYRVAVTEGNVDVVRMDKSGRLLMICAEISHGQVLVLNPEGNPIKFVKKDPERISAWRIDRSIYVDGMNLTEIGQELSRHFNIQAKVNHPRYDTNRYTIDLNNQSLSQVLERLTLLTGISYSLDNNSLTINPSDKR